MSRGAGRRLKNERGGRGARAFEHEGDDAPPFLTPSIASCSSLSLVAVHRVQKQAKMTGVFWGVSVVGLILGGGYAGMRGE